MFSKGIWEETTESWDDVNISWRVVGSKYERIMKKDEEKRIVTIENLFERSIKYYKIKFNSNRKITVYSHINYELGTYVIVEADRGEDLGLIIGYSNEGSEIKLLREAEKEEILQLSERDGQEKHALERCIQLVKEYKLNMSVTRCEFQWDLKKITFYYTSEVRVDFRDLVKDLFRYYKIRIWMFSENRRNI